MMQRRFELPIAGLLFAIICLSCSTTVWAENTGQTIAETPQESLVQQENWDRLGVEEPTGVARAELVTFQTLHGIVLGGQSCALLGCDSPRLALGLPTLGGSIGLGGSLLFSRDGITSGHASAINSGVIWGGWLGAASAGLVADLDGDEITGVMMAGQVAGLGVGYLLAQQIRPTAGDTRLVNLGGAWSAFYYLIVTEGILRLRQSRQTMGLGLIGATLSGAGLGAAIASAHPMSAGRVGIISATGVLGVLAGLTAPVIALGDEADRTSVMVSAALGATAGLGIGTLLTRDWDDEEAYQPQAMSFSILPTLDGDGIQGSISGQF